jgi:hypothetical protein
LCYVLGSPRLSRKILDPILKWVKNLGYKKRRPVKALRGFQTLAASWDSRLCISIYFLLASSPNAMVIKQTSSTAFISCNVDKSKQIFE